VTLPNIFLSTQIGAVLKQFLTRNSTPSLATVVMSLFQVAGSPTPSCPALHTDFCRFDHSGLVGKILDLFSEPQNSTQVRTSGDPNQRFFVIMLGDPLPTPDNRWTAKKKRDLR